MWQFPELFLMFLPVTRHKQTSQIPAIRLYRYFLRSGLWAWWAKLVYQVMLTIRGRLITPFVLGSMSVGLKILIRHSFMDLWVWITALVPWPQLLTVIKEPYRMIKCFIRVQKKNELCSRWHIIRESRFWRYFKQIICFRKNKSFIKWKFSKVNHL